MGEQTTTQLQVQLVFDGVPFDAAAVLHTLRHLAMRVGWRFVRDVAGAPRYIRSIVTRPGGVAYLGTTFDGVVRLGLDGSAGDKVWNDFLGAAGAALQ